MSVITTKCPRCLRKIELGIGWYGDGDVNEHYFKMPDATTGDPHRECCAQCGLNIRDAIHKRSHYMNVERPK